MRQVFVLMSFAWVTIAGCTLYTRQVYPNPEHRWEALVDSVSSGHIFMSRIDVVREYVNGHSDGQETPEYQRVRMQRIYVMSSMNGEWNNLSSDVFEFCRSMPEVCE